jgi:hypothetical protein
MVFVGRTRELAKLLCPNSLHGAEMTAEVEAFHEPGDLPAARVPVVACLATNFCMTISLPAPTLGAEDVEDLERTHPTTRSRPPRRRSSTRPPRRGPSLS